MKTVFITGISGLLGANLAHVFLQEGYKVTGLVRNTASYKGIRHPDLELVEGSLFGDLSDYLQYADIVVHAAAETRQCLPDYTSYHSVNYNATVLLYFSSVNCRVKQFIYISTANTSGYGTKELPGREYTPVKSPFDKSFYAKSKVAAEEFILGTESSMKVTILNPTFMLGAWDSKPSSGKIILMGWNKKIVFTPPGGKNFVHAGDVAKATLLSIERGNNKEKYLIAGENLTYKEFFTKVAANTAQNTLLITVPRGMLMAAGYLGELFRKLGVPTNLCINNMKILCVNNFYSSEKSARQLGLEYRSVEQAISDAINYFKENKKTRKNRNNASISFRLLSRLCRPVVQSTTFGNNSHL